MPPDPWLTGIPAISGSSVRVADVQSSAMDQAMTWISGPFAPSVTPWQV